jgi:hypothetical protein
MVFRNLIGKRILMLDNRQVKIQFEFKYPCKIRLMSYLQMERMKMCTVSQR